MISIFDLFSIGIGPSSSHTVGPMRAAREFLENLGDQLMQVNKLQITLYGSLAYTGRGHGTNTAIMIGLLGEKPETVNPNNVDATLQSIREQHDINLLNKHSISFHEETDIQFDFDKAFAFHSNAMEFKALDASGNLIHSDIYFSIGGGFIINQNDVGKPANESHVPFDFDSAKQLLDFCTEQQCDIAKIVMKNELTLRSETDIINGILNLADVMFESIDKGCNSTDKELPGRLRVQRRAARIYKNLLKQGTLSPKHPQVMNWLNAFAMAVNEQNAAGKRVVTAPTNGAAGIIPAVLRFYLDYNNPTDRQEKIVTYLLTATAIGILYKKNASISGAEMGCQGEVGVAASMAAGALAAVMGGTVLQVENAAEIAMEHSLGLTCDPIDGLVQIPCIERNAMGAVKAYNAAQISLAEEGDHKVSLDMVIATMFEIGSNMNSIYKETAKGGLAVNVTEC